MAMNLSTSIPAGFHIYGEGFATDTAGGGTSATFRTPPGQSRAIYLNIKAEKPGRAQMHFSCNYWPDGNKDRFSPASLPHPFTVESPSRNPFLEAAGSARLYPDNPPPKIYRPSPGWQYSIIANPPEKPAYSAPAQLFCRKRLRPRTADPAANMIELPESREKTQSVVDRAARRFP